MLYQPRIRNDYIDSPTISAQEDEIHYGGASAPKIRPPTAAALLVSMRENKVMRRARRNMINHQLQAEGVHDRRILDAFYNLPREYFIPEPYKALAYMDEEIPLSGGQSLLRPSRTAKLLSLAGITAEMRCMVMPCDGGYCAALISYLAETVVLLDSDKARLVQAEVIYKMLGLDSISGVLGAPVNGFTQCAPYDRILITQRVTDVPLALLQQLAEHGKLFAIIERENLQTLTEFGRSDDGHFYARGLESLSISPIGH